MSLLLIIGYLLDFTVYYSFEILSNLGTFHRIVHAIFILQNIRKLHVYFIMRPKEAYWIQSHL